MQKQQPEGDSSSAADSTTTDEEGTSGDETDDEDDDSTTYYSTGSTLDVPVPWWFSSRLALAIFAFFGCMSMASQRVCMDVAIHCMVNDSFLNGQDIITTTDFPEFNSTEIPKTALEIVEAECGMRPRVFPENLTLHTTWEAVFDWSHEKQDVVFGMYFWGYLLSQIPSGWMATRYGGKWVIGGMTMLASICTGLVPLAARSHYYTLILLRFLSGFGAGVMFPAMYAVWSRWSPPEERSRLASIGFTGAMLGHTATFPLTAVLCEYGLDGGWPSIFYLLGILGVIWSTCWMLFASSSPMQHGRISKEEKEYILETLSGEGLLNGEQYDNTPWLSFFGSVPFMVLVVNSFTCEWGMYNFNVSIPHFMKKKLKYDIDMDPAIHAFPYIGLGFLIFMTGIWSDKLRLRGVIKTSIVRKAFQAIGTIIPAALMVGIGFLGCHQAAGAVSMLVLAMTALAFQFNGYVMNHLDIAPKHAGILLGISSAVGNLAPALAPVLQGYIITEDTWEQWQTWFLITASLYLFGTLLYVLGAAGDLQEWAECDDYIKYETSSSSSASPSPPPPQSVVAIVPVRSKSINVPMTAKRKSGDGHGGVSESVRAAMMVGGVAIRPAVMPTSTKPSTPAGSKRLSAPDLPSELHRAASQKGTSGSKKSSAPDVSKPAAIASLAPPRTARKRSDISDESEASSSKSANVRRPTAGDISSASTGGAGAGGVGKASRPTSKHEPKAPPNLDSLAESIV